MITETFPLSVPSAERIMREVLVFRTSVHGPRDVDELRPWLDHVITPRGRWTFDLEDRDRVLRVETAGQVRERVLALLHGMGYACDELE